MIDGFWDAVGRSLFDGSAPRSARPCSGGCIHDARVLENGKLRFFVKAARNERSGMFQAEAEGLAELASRSSFRVPEVVRLGETDGRSWLALEHLDISVIKRNRKAEASEE